MKKFIKKNWIRLSIVGLGILSIVTGWMKYGKHITNFLSHGTDLDALERERRSKQRSVDSGFEGIDRTLGRAEDIEQQIRERDKRVSERSGDVTEQSERVSERGEELSRTSDTVSDINKRIEDRIQRNKELLREL